MKDVFQQNGIWVLLPAYNEEKYIRAVLQSLISMTSNYVVIDDGSSDRTAGIAQKFGEHVLVHRYNLGKGGALKTGCEYIFRRLKGKAVIFMDSDAQHNPEELTMFCNALLSGNDLVFGVRSFGKEMPLLRIIGNRLASWMVYLLFGRYIPDIPSGYKAMTKKGYQQVKWDSADYGVELEIAVRTAKNKIHFADVQITTIYHDLARGMTILDVAKMLWQVILLRLVL